MSSWAWLDDAPAAVGVGSWPPAKKDMLRRYQLSPSDQQHSFTSTKKKSIFVNRRKSAETFYDNFHRKTRRFFFNLFSPTIIDGGIFLISRLGSQWGWGRRRRRRRRRRRPQKEKEKTLFFFSVFWIIFRARLSGTLMNFDGLLGTLMDFSGTLMDYWEL